MGIIYMLAADMRKNMATARYIYKQPQKKAFGNKYWPMP